MKNRNIFLLFGGILGGVLVVSGCGQPNGNPSDTNPIESSSTTSSATSTVSFPDNGTGQLTREEQSTWKIYADQKKGFEFYYHPDLQVMNGLEEAGPFTYQVAFSFPKEWYLGTNLQNVLLGIQASTSCPNLNAPREEEYHGPLPVKINNGKVDFTREYSTEAATGNYYTSLVYSTKQGDTCYGVLVNFHSVNRMNYDETNRPKEYDPKKFEDVLKKVVSTFKILK